MFLFVKPVFISFFPLQIPYNNIKIGNKQLP